MKKQFLVLMLSAITCLVSSVLAMDEPPPDTFIITKKEADIINDHLANGERVTINGKRIKAGSKIIETAPSKTPTGQTSPKKVFFASDAYIFWEGNGILDVEAQDNIVFANGAIIKNQGKGGLRLVSREGEIEFQGSAPQIDFVESEGAICILNDTSEKDHNDFIRRSDKVLYNSFEFIENDLLTYSLNNLKRLKDRIKGNPNSHYSFFPNSSGKIPYTDSPFTEDFSAENIPVKGIFNLNGRTNFSSETHTIRCFNSQTKQWYPVWNTHPCIVSFVFEHYLNLKEGNWGEHVIFMAPPLEEKQNNLLTCLEKGMDLEAKEFIPCQSQNWGRWETWYSGRLAFYNGVEKNTPLHVAAKMGCVESLKLMLTYMFKPFVPVIKCDKSDLKYLVRNPLSLLDRKNAEGFKPIDLAVQYGHIDIVNEIMSYYTRYNVPHLLGKERLVSLATEQEKNVLSMKSFLNSFEDPPLLFSKEIQGFPIKNKALDKEYERQQQVERRFFLHCKKPKNLRQPGTTRTRWIFDDFKTNYDSRKSISPYNLEGIPSRSRIILLQAITNHKLSTYQSSKHKKYWADLEENYGDKPYTVDNYDLFPIKYQLGGTIHTITNRPTKEKPGYAYYHEIGSYERICCDILEIEQSVSSQKIATLLKRARLTGKHITAQKLEKKGYRNRGTNSSQADANYLNNLHFLLDLEVASRLVNNSPSEYDKLPIGCANARAFSLQKRDQLSFKELLSKQSSYHPFTDRDESKTPITRENAIKKINKKIHKHSNTHDKALTAEIAEWQALHPGGHIIKTPEGLHQELLEEYGGDYESSGEEYSLEM